MTKSCLVELRKLFLSTAFWIGVVAIAVLCLTAPIYEDYATGKTYTVIETLLQVPHSVLETDGMLSDIMVFGKGLTGQYATLFVPLVVGLGFVPICCEERVGGQLRFQLIRTGRLRLCISKLCAAMLSGGCILLFGFGLYGIFVFACFPSLTPEIAEEQMLTLSSPLHIHILKLCFGKFLYGMIAVCPAFLMCAFCNLPHFNLCMPFLFCFLQNTAVEQLFSDNMTLYTLASWSKPSRVSLLMFQFSTEGALIAALWPIIGFLVYYFCLRKRVDCGA